MEYPFTNVEKKLMEVWDKGAQLLKYDRIVRRVCTGEDDVVSFTGNRFVRLIAINLAFFHGLDVKQHYSQTLWLGIPRSRVKVEIKTIFIFRPKDVSVAQLTARLRNLVELRERYNTYHKRKKELSSGISSRKYAAEIPHSAWPVLEPVKEGESTAMMEGRIPLDVMGRIFGDVPVKDLCSVLRVCRWWRDVGGKSVTMWRSHLEQLVGGENAGEKVAPNVDQMTLVAAYKAALKEALALRGSTPCPKGCVFMGIHAHLKKVPIYASEIKKKC